MNTPRLDPDMSSPTSNEQWMQQLPAIRRALLNEHRHIVVSSGSTQVLEEAGMALVRDLLKTPGVKVLSQQPASTDVILQRFNQLLADINVDHALDRQALSPEAIHVFVIHDGPSLQHSDYALMARLVSDLPGAQMRLVVIVDTALSATERVQAVGRKALHWAVGPSKRATAHWLTGESPSSTATAPAQSPVTHSFAKRPQTASPQGTSKARPSAPKQLWLGLGGAALLAIGVATWLWAIDQAPPSALITDSPAASSNSAPAAATSSDGAGTSRISGTITQGTPPSPSPESRP